MPLELLGLISTLKLITSINISTKYTITKTCGLPNFKHMLHVELQYKDVDRTVERKMTGSSLQAFIAYLLISSAYSLFTLTGGRARGA